MPPTVPSPIAFTNSTIPEEYDMSANSPPPSSPSFSSLLLPSIPTTHVLTSTTSNVCMTVPPPSYDAALLAHSLLHGDALRHSIVQLAASFGGSSVTSGLSHLTITGASPPSAPLPPSHTHVITDYTPPILIRTASAEDQPLDLSTKQPLLSSSSTPCPLSACSSPSLLASPSSFLQPCPSPLLSSPSPPISSSSSKSLHHLHRPQHHGASRSPLSSQMLRRSASSVSSSPSSSTTTVHDEADVLSHFRRSLSGKWPRRMVSESGRPASFRRPPSAASNNNAILITTTTKDSIHDLFRRALGDEDFAAWKATREEKEVQRKKLKMEETNNN